MKGMLKIEKLKLKNIIQRAEEILSEDKYKKDTINDYKFVWKKFYDMCELFNVEYFDFDLAINFLKKYYHIDTQNKKGRNYARRMRSIYILDCIDKNIPIGIYKPTIENKIPKEYIEVFNKYESYLIHKKYSKSCIFSTTTTLNKFFNYLVSKRIILIKNIKIQDIYNYINNLDTDIYSQHTIYNIKYQLKNFFQYLYNNHEYGFSGNDIFPKVQKVERSILPSYYTIEEINKILEQVDRKTKKGKRDFAIMLLAIVYGLRNSDIVHLKYSNILWNQDKIELLQYKTKKLLELPLTNNVKYAILDYLKNARPNIESPYIFLPTKPPYNFVNNEKYSTLYRSIETYIKKANIDINGRKRGLHTLRHSLASNMLKNNIEISTISSVLGHSSVDVTNNYLSIDIEQLRKLSLEVPHYE